ncbi:MAG TPA: hypothetical protein VNL71_17885, partial [Chloroflexota bacterium]|nr:hypothetical protein [Chloroflexota bacterium]
PHRGPLYWRDDPLVAAFTITLTAHAAEREHERQRVNYRQTILQRILDQAAIRDEQQAYERFLRDFGDLDLWEGHKKALPRSHYPTHDLFRLITILDEHQVAFDGLRVDQALGLAIRQGWLDNQPLAPAPALLDLVLADPPSPSGASG